MQPYPTMSKLIAQDKTPEAYDLMMTTVKRVLFLALGAQIIMSSIGAELATIIYGGRLLEGQAEDIGVCVSFADVDWSVGMVCPDNFARGFYAKGNTWTPTILEQLSPFFSILCMYSWEINSVCGDLLGRVPLQLRFMSLR